MRKVIRNLVCFMFIIGAFSNHSLFAQEENRVDKEPNEIKLETTGKKQGNSTTSLTDNNGIPLFTSNYSPKEQKLLSKDGLFVDKKIENEDKENIEGISIFSKNVIFSNTVETETMSGYDNIILFVVVIGAVTKVQP